MTLATYVETPSPRRAPDDGAVDLLPADLTVAFGAAATPVPGSVPLGEFLATAGTLTLAERLVLVEQALVLLEGNYVHLPLKSAMHAVNPVQRLRVLRARLLRQTDTTMDPERSFHLELSGVFHSVRDLHTNYLLPAPFNGQIAYLPFQVERCVDGGRPVHLVGRVAPGHDVPPFGVGVEITHWNGMPIERAVAVNADRYAGSNMAARLARGIDSLTVRPLRMHLPPDEEWVTVSYIDPDGVHRELREQWLVAANAPAMADDDEVTSAAAQMGLDLLADENARARALLFAPVAVEQQYADATPELETEPVAEGGEVTSTMPLVFRARSVRTASGTFGHLRVFTFHVPEPRAFVAEFVRLLGLLPQEGLILDVRGNGGGNIVAGESTLQTLTPRRITPEPVQFICTPLNLEICRRHTAANPTTRVPLGQWFPSMDQAVETGSIYSSAFPLTPDEQANEIGQRYFGPVVLVTDARCYSATDVFAAGFQDHAVGQVLGVDENTGAGGANVWPHHLLRALRETPPDPDTPYAALPKQAGMRVSVRRTLRVGALAGTPVEDLGVRPDVRHELTRRDVLEGNLDLLDAAGALLAGRPVRCLGFTAALSGDGTLSLELVLQGVDRVDVHVDGRPRGTHDVQDGECTVVVPGVSGARSVRVEGFFDGELVAARTEPL